MPDDKIPVQQLNLYIQIFQTFQIQSHDLRCQNIRRLVAQIPRITHAVGQSQRVFPVFRLFQLGKIYGFQFRKRLVFLFGKILVKTICRTLQLQSQTGCFFCRQSIVSAADNRSFFLHFNGLVNQRGLLSAVTAVFNRDNGNFSPVGKKHRAPFAKIIRLQSPRYFPPVRFAQNFESQNILFPIGTGKHNQRTIFVVIFVLKDKFKHCFFLFCGFFTDYIQNFITNP